MNCVYEGFESPLIRSVSAADVQTYLTSHISNFSDRRWNKQIKCRCEWSSPIKTLLYEPFTAESGYTFVCDDSVVKLSAWTPADWLVSAADSADVQINNDGTCFWVICAFH